MLHCIFFYISSRILCKYFILFCTIFGSNKFFSQRENLWAKEREIREKFRESSVRNIEACELFVQGALCFCGEFRKRRRNRTHVSLFEPPSHSHFPPFLGRALPFNLSLAECLSHSLVPIASLSNSR